MFGIMMLLCAFAVPTTALAVDTIDPTDIKIRCTGVSIDNEVETCVGTSGSCTGYGQYNQCLGASSKCIGYHIWSPNDPNFDHCFGVRR